MYFVLYWQLLDFFIRVLFNFQVPKSIQSGLKCVLIIWNDYYNCRIILYFKEIQIYFWTLRRSTSIKRVRADCRRLKDTIIIIDYTNTYTVILGEHCYWSKIIIEKTESISLTKWYVYRAILGVNTAIGCVYGH